MAEQVTVPDIRARKRSRGADPIVMITAYDCAFARLVDAAGVDVILVGDTLAEVVLGHDDTLHVGIEDLAHHVGAVARARAAGAARGRHAVAHLPPRGERHRSQRRRPRAGRRPGRQARGRTPPRPCRAGDPRRRDTGDGPPRAHAAVGSRHGRLQGSRTRGGCGRRASARRRGAGRSRMLRDRARGRARRSSPSA